MLAEVALLLGIAAVATAGLTAGSPLLRPLLTEMIFSRRDGEGE